MNHNSAIYYCSLKRFLLNFPLKFLMIFQTLFCFVVGIDRDVFIQQLLHCGFPIYSSLALWYYL